MNRLHFGVAAKPPKLTHPKWQPLLLVVACLFAAMALAQLADFEGFIGSLNGYQAFDDGALTAFAVIIAAIEILSLPILLRFSLSPAMRLVSSVSVLLVPLVWLALTLTALAGGLHIANYGWFGSFLEQPFGWWVLFKSILLLGVSVCTLYILHGKRLLP